MRMEILNKNQLKIEIDCDDMCLLRHECGEDDCGENSPCEMLGYLLRQARDTTGFDTRCAHIIIKAEKTDGITTVIMTRLDDEDEDGQSSYIKSVSVGFDSFDDLADCCAELQGCGCILASSLYIYLDRYYISLTIPTMTGMHGGYIKLINTLGEYGSLKEDALFDAVLREHGSLIASIDAVDRLCRS